MAEPKLNDMRVVKDPHAELYHVERFVPLTDGDGWQRANYRHGWLEFTSKDDAMAWIEREKLAPIVVAEIPA